MSAGAPWSVKGIDPKAREVAKDLARRSGMTLGEWLNRVILEDDVPEEVTAESQFGERPLRGHGIGAASLSPPRLHAVPSFDTPPELARVAAALDRLTDRIEASETRTGLAITGVEHSVRQALARIETAERDQHAQTVRLEGQHSGLLERLNRLEAEPAGPRSAEALRAIEGRLARVEPELVVETVLQRLGDRLAAAEAHTAAALDDLTGALTRLDRRIAAVEGGADGALEPRFEALAARLTQEVEASRAEVAERLAAATDGGLEARFAELAAQVQTAERRSARAVEEIGRQVLSMAEAVGRKLTEVDEKSAGAIDQVGAEIARIAGAVELRLARQEQTQAEGFERLQAQLSQVTDTLGERVSASERRTAVAIDEVEDEVTRVSARFAPPTIEAVEAVEPAENLPPLDDPQDDDEASFVRPGLAEIIQSLGPPPEPEPESALEPPPPLAEAEAIADDDQPFRQPVFAVHSDDDDDVEVVTPPWRRLDLDIPSPSAPGAFVTLPDEVDEALFAPPRAEPEAPELSTREVIERARAAARAAQEPPVEVRAKVDRKAASGRLFQGFGARPKKAAPNSALQTAMMIAGGAAFLSVGAAGLTLLQGPGAAGEQAPLPEAPRAAMALGPAHFSSTGEQTAADPAPPVFAEVRAEVEAGAPGALAKLKALAEANHAQAQLYLAQLYDGGEAGLPQNPAEARRLTALAAENGDVRAMHNLAVYEFRGEGGPQDVAGAARWFRKAAEAGVVESQYNLGLLYQSGNGVARDVSEARRWFARAAAKGDAEARRALANLTPKPQPPAPKTAAKPAPARNPPGPALAGASMNIRQTQMILTRLGYYTGPIDGVDSTAYHRALVEYRRDQDGGVPLYTSTR